MLEKEREINKGKIDFKISEEHKQVRLDQIESISNGSISNLLVKGFNMLIDMKVKIDGFLGSNAGKIHDFIVDFLIGG